MERHRLFIHARENVVRHLSGYRSSVEQHFAAECSQFVAECSQFVAECSQFVAECSQRKLCSITASARISYVPHIRLDLAYPEGQCRLRLDCGIAASTGISYVSNIRLDIAFPKGECRAAAAKALRRLANYA
jgi:hypothetical protein